MPLSSQRERLAWIDARIQAGHIVDAAAVAARFAVSRATAFSDRQELERLGACFNPQRGVGWRYADPSFRLRQVAALTDAGREALRQARLALQEYGSPADVAAFDAFLQSVEQERSLGDTRLESVDGALHPTIEASSRPDLLAACRRGLRRRRRLFIRYWSAHNDEETQRRVRPYHLRNFRGEWYLIAWCENRQSVRDFALSRIREWRLLDDEPPFAPDPNFSIDAYVAAGWETRHSDAPVAIQLRFTPYQSRWIRERRYHPSQILHERPDGGVDMHLRIAGTVEIRRWILGFGSDVEVMQPESLRHNLAQEAKKIQEIYASPTFLDSDRR